MPHEILGERFIERGEKLSAWHKIGHTFTEQISVQEAIERAKLDYTVSLERNHYFYQGEQIPSSSYTLVREPLPDDPYPRDFGTVSEHYKVVQNTEVFHLLDGLVEEWPIETAGVLKQGRTAFMLLKFGEAEIRGRGGQLDPLIQYFLVSNYIDARHSIMLLPTDVRVVCANTESAAVKGAKVIAKIQHRHDAKEEAAYQVQLMAEMIGASEKVIAAFNRMALAQIVESQLKDILAEVFKEPAKPKELLRPGKYGSEQTQKAEARYTYEYESAVKTRANCIELFQKANDETPGFENSAWLAYNAITEQRDHHWSSHSAKAAESVLFGERAADKVRAFLLLEDFTEKALSGYALPEFALRS
jgi:phage/plasmid-like protein (TIGR03299 family)